MSQNFHAGSRPSQEYLYDINVATPSHAERARTLVESRPNGTLSTLCLDPAGFPYGSVVTMALLQGNPVFLISGLAEHTKNLRQDRRSSLLVTEIGEENPLALGRVTLLGECEELAGEATETGKAAYLKVHPQAEYYLNYGDFSFWQLRVESIRYIGGFGRMSWVDVQEYLAAAMDPLAGSAKGIIEHMNDDHKESMTLYCRAFSKAQNFSDVAMTAVDRYGFEMSVETPEGWRPVRLAFDAPVELPGQVRKAMVDLAKSARAKLG